MSVVRVVGNLLDFIFSDPTFFKFHESQQNKLEVLKTKIDNFTPEKKVDYLVFSSNMNFLTFPACF